MSLSSLKGIVVWSSVYRVSAPDARVEMDERGMGGLELAGTVAVLVRNR